MFLGLDLNFSPNQNSVMSQTKFGTSSSTRLTPLLMLGNRDCTTERPEGSKRLSSRQSFPTVLTNFLLVRRRQTSEPPDTE